MDYPDESNDIMIEVLVRDKQEYQSRNIERLRMWDNGSEFGVMYLEGGGRGHKPRKI